MRHLPKKTKNKSTSTKETQKVLYVSSAIVLVAVIEENFLEELAFELGPETEFFQGLQRRKGAFQDTEQKKPV